MEFLDPKLDEFVVNHSGDESELLKKLNRETNVKILMPRMLSGRLQGRVLSMISHMIQPKTILEIGTYTGYSALCMAEGMQKNGSLITIDINEELEDFTRSFFLQSEYNNNIDYRIGNALDIIPTIEEEIDLVFIDADKDNYSNYFDLVLPKMRKGGFIIADNVLWSGKVIDDEANDKDTMALKAYSKKINEDDRVENVLFPIRDGLMIARKL